MKIPVIITIIILLSNASHAQLSDSLVNGGEFLQTKDDSAYIIKISKRVESHHLIRSLIIPSALTAYGFIALDNHKLKSLDGHIKEEVWTEHPHQPNHFDDGLQYMPGLSVYVLNGLGIPGKNNLLDATRQYLISSLAMMVVVQSIKKITRLRRPDGFGSNTFPSGHASTAFVAAEFLNQEYKGRSIIYPIVGYTMASVVGYMRLYNNRHWFKDIISGAGIGMGVTKLVYWAYPTIKKTFFKDRAMHAKMPCY